MSEEKRVKVVLITSKIVCNSCGRIAEHPCPLDKAIESVMYSDGCCPQCHSNDIGGQDVETTIEYEGV
jgi:Zn finger protein HypA/HybF involved in hydrogenase expression